MSHLLASILAQQPQVVPTHAAHSAAAGQHTSMLPLEVILVLAGVLIGRIWGRRSGLRHLGESEFKSRLAAARRVRKW